MPKQKKKKKGGTQNLCLLYLNHRASPEPDIEDGWMIEDASGQQRSGWRISEAEADNYCQKFHGKPTCREAEVEWTAPDGTTIIGYKRGCWPAPAPSDDDYSESEDNSSESDDDSSEGGENSSEGDEDDDGERRRHSSSNRGGKRKTRKKRKKKTKRHRRRKKTKKPTKRHRRRKKTKKRTRRRRKK